MAADRGDRLAINDADAQPTQCSSNDSFDARPPTATASRAADQGYLRTGRGGLDLSGHFDPGLGTTHYDDPHSTTAVLSQVRAQRCR